MTAKRRPWWKDVPERLWSPEDRKYAIQGGWKPSAAQVQRELREKQRLREARMFPPPPDAGLFSHGPTMPERKEVDRQRRRVNAILKKHGLLKSDHIVDRL